MTGLELDDLPAPVLAKLREGESSVGRLALQFTILTAARTGESVGAKWDEIDTSNFETLGYTDYTPGLWDADISFACAKNWKNGPGTNTGPCMKPFGSR